MVGMSIHMKLLCFCCVQDTKAVSEDQNLTEDGHQDNQETEDPKVEKVESEQGEAKTESVGTDVKSGDNLSEGTQRNQVEQTDIGGTGGE